MNIFGAIGLALALKNYKKVLAEYNGEVELVNSQNDEMQLEIDTYTDYTASIFNEKLQKGDPFVDYENGELIDILPTPILHISTFYKHIIEALITDSEPKEVVKAAPQVILQNVTNERIYVYGFGVLFKLFGADLTFGTNEYLRFTLDPEQKAIISFPLPNAAEIARMVNDERFFLTKFIKKIFTDAYKTEFILTDELRMVRNYLLNKYGDFKKVPHPYAITTIDSEQAITADIEVWYCKDSDMNIRRAVVQNLPGILEWDGQYDGHINTLVSQGIVKYSVENWRVDKVNE